MKEIIKKEIIGGIVANIVEGNLLKKLNYFDKKEDDKIFNESDP